MTSGAAHVLVALREAGDAPCSGAALSERLGVSRAQVWKHVEALRARGYTVEGEPGGGYRLLGAPDRLFPEEIANGLATRWLAQTIHHHEETDSTNRVAHDLAREGAPHGTAVIAEAQTAGRGRLGRSFFSPAHANLYTSVLLRPRFSITQAPTAILAAAIAVAETVAETVGDASAVEIKWPNDVLLGGRKTTGILMEMASEATQVGHLVLGIGVNLNVDPAGFPDDFRDRATSLRAFLGTRVDRIAFTRALYGTLEDVLDRHAETGFSGLRPRFDAYFRMGGSAITVHEVGGTTISGTTLGVAEDGALRLEPSTGGPEVRVLAGDVTLRDRPGAPAA